MKYALPIIVVEDDDMIREGLCDYLTFEGFQVFSAPNGKLGLDLIRQHQGRCLVLLDLQMPVMTGEQVLEALENESSQALRSAPVIILTARAERLIHPGIKSFLKKPIDLNHLIAQIEDILALEV